MYVGLIDTLCFKSVTQLLEITATCCFKNNLNAIIFIGTVRASVSLSLARLNSFSRDLEHMQTSDSVAPDLLRRSANRVPSKLPVEIDGIPGLTKNVSATGVYLETTADQVPGSRVHFVVDVVVNGENLKMVCAGEVTRVEHKMGIVGVAVKLTSSFFTDTDHSEDPVEQEDD